MRRSGSITRRLIATVLLLEVLSALGLIAAVVVHERHVQMEAFDTSLRGAADSLMGAVQDAEDEHDNVMLDLREVPLAKTAVYRVREEGGKVLGASRDADLIDVDERQTHQQQMIKGRRYRFYTLHGVRIIDPGKSNGGVRHQISVVYGAPAGHVWHEVMEAVRFYVAATALLLSLTTLAMIWLIRRGLAPIRELAFEAERITPADWRFVSPASARETEELRPLAAALEGALTRLRRSFEQQRRFTSDAAHELKTDVAIVKSSLQLLSMRRRSAEEYGRGLALSLDDFTRLEKTVEKMLTLARLEQPREGREQHCNLNDVLEDAVQQSSSFAELKGVALETSLEMSAVAPLDSRDAALLCSNILVNALQHSPQGGTVKIRLTGTSNRAVLTVADEGSGINEEDKPFLFEPFYRGDASRSRKSGGTGLGLSICRAICDRVGGSIEIANGLTGGAAVTVVLPVSEAATGSPAALSGSLKEQSAHS